MCAAEAEVKARVESLGLASIQVEAKRDMRDRMDGRHARLILSDQKDTVWSMNIVMEMNRVSDSHGSFMQAYLSISLNPMNSLTPKGFSLCKHTLFLVYKREVRSLVLGINIGINISLKSKIRGFSL